MLNSLRIKFIVAFIFCFFTKNGVAITPLLEQDIKHSVQNTKYPVLKNFVTDNAFIFSSSEKENLDFQLQNYETETTNQIVILTVNSLEGIPIEEYALKVFEINKIGQKDKDNGVLILFSKNDRKVRIEVGYGLEPYLTDFSCAKIINQLMIPKFKKEQYNNGILEATYKIIELLNNPELAQEYGKKETKSGSSLVSKIFFILFLLVFVSVGLLMFLFVHLDISTNVIEAFLTGKLGIFTFFFVLFRHIFLGVFVTAFIGMPIIAGVSILSDVDITREKVFSILIPIFSISLFTPFVLAIKNMIANRKRLKISFITKNDYTIFSSSGKSRGSSSYSSSSRSSSSSSSSSFSGGGGSSGGGGASGSW